MPRRRRAVERVRLTDGRVVHVRPIRPDDLDELRRAIRDADPETLRSRFLGGRPPQTDEELRRLVEVDHVTREAFVALTPEGRGVGIARYEGLPDGRSVDVAVAVDPEWRRVGLATALLTRLMRAALKQGLSIVHADYFAANRDIADLMRRAATTEERHVCDGVVEETAVLDPEVLDDEAFSPS